MYPLSSEEVRILEGKNIREGDRVDHVFRSGKKMGFFIGDGAGNFFLCPLQSTFDEMKSKRSKADSSKKEPLDDLPRIRPWEDHRPRLYRDKMRAGNTAA